MPPPKTLRFLHLFATSRGGAGRAAWRLHQGLRKAGHESRTIMLEVKPQDEADLVAASGGKVFKLRRLLTKAQLKLEARSDYCFGDELLSPGLGRRELAAAAAFAPDIIVVHAISDFLAPGDVHALQVVTRAKVVWHLMDMAPMTGGCHYSWSCMKYRAACSECPALLLPSKHDRSVRAFQAKAFVMSKIEGLVVAPSSALAVQSRAATLFRGLRVETVLHGLAPEEFVTRGQAVERQSFGIKTEGPVIFFGAQHFKERRKGMPVLLEALRKLPALLPRGAPRPFLLTAGNLESFPHPSSLGYESRNLGYIDAATLARAYAAADIFACPSVEESGPVMVNEALMSGTVVVAFRMGVVPDLVEPGQTGEIAELGDADSFARCLASVLSWGPERKVAARLLCQSTAIEKCDAKTQVARFVTVAESLINANT